MVMIQYDLSMLENSIATVELQDSRSVVRSGLLSDSDKSPLRKRVRLPSCKSYQGFTEDTINVNATSSYIFTWINLRRWYHIYWQGGRDYSLH